MDNSAFLNGFMLLGQPEAASGTPVAETVAAGEVRQSVVPCSSAFYETILQGDN